MEGSVNKKELVDYIYRWTRLNMRPEFWVTKKELNRFKSRRLYGAWQALAIRGEKRCGIVDKINREKIGRLTFAQPISSEFQIPFDFSMEEAS